MFARIVSGVMQEVTREDFHPRTLIHLHALVDVRPEPAAARFAIKTQLPIGIPATTANPASHVEGAPRDRISIGKLRFVCGAQLLDRVSQLIRQSFSSKLFLFSKAGPWMNNHSRAAFSSDLARVVSRFRIDDYDLIRPSHGLARRANVVGFVEGDNGG